MGVKLKGVGFKDLPRDCREAGKPKSLQNFFGSCGIDCRPAFLIRSAACLGASSARRARKSAASQKHRGRVPFTERSPVVCYEILTRVALAYARAVRRRRRITATANPPPNNAQAEGLGDCRHAEHARGCVKGARSYFARESNRVEVS